MGRLDFIKNRKFGRLFITISAVASMFGLLLIQVNWLKESINMQEAIFTKGVNMALKQTALKMANDEELTVAMQNSFDKDSLINSQEVFTQNIVSRLDSTVQKELEFYHINLDFHFILINGEDTISVNPQAKVKNGELFHESFNSPVPDKSIDLAIHFPGRSTFILKRIGIMFATSILLIVFNLVSILLILAYYRRERLFAQQVKDMIGNLTHEFMTPISSISLAGNMILSRSQKSGDEHTNQFAAVIKEENKKLQRQVDRLLQLAAIENSGFEYHKIPVDVHQLIRDAMKDMAFQLKQNEAEVITDLQASSAIIYADEIHLTSVFANLISNSIKYSNKKPLINITSRNIDQKIEITFSDNGIGIQSKEFKRIFEKYYRISTGDMHNTKGFGIGLYYSKTVVAAHEGTITVKSEQQKGTSFTITLPLINTTTETH
jgi:two-component system phosphate regulon sensor histidine kinase PhoR